LPVHDSPTVLIFGVVSSQFFVAAAAAAGRPPGSLSLARELHEVIQEAKEEYPDNPLKWAAFYVYGHP
jgi:hypothetical protein